MALNSLLCADVPLSNYSLTPYHLAIRAVITLMRSYQFTYHDY